MQFLILLLVTITNAKRPFVTIEDGSLVGIQMTTIEGRTISAFRNIPFATPPVGKLRFKISTKLRQLNRKWKKDLSQISEGENEDLVKGAVQHCTTSLGFQKEKDLGGFYEAHLDCVNKKVKENIIAIPYRFPYYNSFAEVVKKIKKNYNI